MRPLATPGVATTALARRAPSSASKLIVLTGLVVSVFLLLVAYVDRSSQSSAVFGFLTILFFLLLLRLPRGR